MSIGGLPEPEVVEQLADDAGQEDNLDDLGKQVIAYFYYIAYLCANIFEGKFLISDHKILWRCGKVSIECVI